MRKNYICGCDDKYFAKGLCRYHYNMIYFLDNQNYYRKKCKNYQKRHIKEKTLYYKKYRLTKKGKEATLRAVRKYELNHPEKRNTWNKAQAIIRKSCIICGDINSIRHHPDINKPLKVIMLCHRHHKEVHRQMI